MSQIYILWSPTTGIDSVYSTLQSASDALVSSTHQEQKHNFALSIQTLIGGTVTLSADGEDVKPTVEKSKPKPIAKSRAKPKAVKAEEEGDEDLEDLAERPKPVAKSRAKPKAVVKAEEEEDEEEEGDGEAAPAIKPKKTKTPAEQRAVNAAKPAKPTDADLPDNVRALLQKGGRTFEGQTVVVTGVPPTLGRKNTERLVEAFGAHLGKSLSKKTGWVVVGNEAGPKKLESIKELGLKVLDEAELVEMLEKEGDGGRAKRGTSELEDDEEGEEEEKPKKVTKKAKK